MALCKSGHHQFCRTIPPPQASLAEPLVIIAAAPNFRTYAQSHTHRSSLPYLTAGFPSPCHCRRYKQSPEAAPPLIAEPNTGLVNTTAVASVSRTPRRCHSQIMPPLQSSIPSLSAKAVKNPGRYAPQTTAGTDLIQPSHRFRSCRADHPKPRHLGRSRSRRRHLPLPCLSPARVSVHLSALMERRKEERKMKERNATEEGRTKKEADEHGKKGAEGKKEGQKRQNRKKGRKSQLSPCFDLLTRVDFDRPKPIFKAQCNLLWTPTAAGLLFTGPSLFTIHRPKPVGPIC